MSETARSTSVDWRQATFDAEKEVAQLRTLLGAQQRVLCTACKEAVSQFICPALGTGQTRPKIKIYTIPTKSFLRLMGRGMWVGSVFEDCGKTMFLTAIGQAYGSRRNKLIDVAAIERSPERPSPNCSQGNRRRP